MDTRPTRGVSPCLLLHATAIALACLPEPAAAQHPDPLDTARVPRLELTEVARIGGDDEREGYLLSGVRGAAVASDAELVLLDAGSRQVRTYGTDGVLRRVFGGPGDGPGDFRAPWSVAVLQGGELVVFDRQLQRVTTVDGEGRVKATADVATSDPMAMMTGSFVGAFPDGSWVQRVDPNTATMRGDAEGPRRDTVVFNHVSAGGEVLGRIAAVEGPLRTLMKHRDAWGDETPIFGRDLRAVVSEGRLVVGLNDALRLSVYSPEGEPLPALSAPRPPRVATSDLVGEERSARVAVAEARMARAADAPGGFRTADMMQYSIDVAKEVPAEKTLPAFEDLLAESGGRIWVLERRPPGEEGERWFRTTPDLRPDGWIEVPGGGRLLAAGHGLVISVARDEMDVERVIVYAVRRAGREARRGAPTPGS